MLLAEVSDYISAMKDQTTGDKVTFRTTVKSEQKRYSGEVVGQSDDAYKVKTPDGKVWTVNKMDIVKRV